jgi:hypothetical protein
VGQAWNGTPYVTQLAVPVEVALQQTFGCAEPTGHAATAPLTDEGATAVGVFDPTLGGLVPESLSGLPPSVGSFPPHAASSQGSPRSAMRALVRPK